MTVSTQKRQRQNIGLLLRRASNLAGALGAGQRLGESDREMARDFLRTIIDDLGTDGVQAREFEFFNLPLTVGTYRYDLATDLYMGIDGDGMYIPVGTVDLTKATGETLVTQISRDRWHQLSVKSAESSRPTLFYLFREFDTMQAWFWPIPDEAGWVRLPMERVLSDVNDDNATLDLERHWSMHIQFQLAYLVAEAKSMPADKLKRLADFGAYYKKKALSVSNERLPQQLVPEISYGYGYRR